MPNATLTSAALSLNDCSTGSTRSMYPIGLGRAHWSPYELPAQDMANECRKVPWSTGLRQQAT